MKTSAQIAKECQVPQDLVVSINYSHKITNLLVKKKYLYNEEQEKEMHKILYFCYGVREMVLESKMNIMDFMSQEEIMDTLKN